MVEGGLTVAGLIMGVFSEDKSHTPSWLPPIPDVVPVYLPKPTSLHLLRCAIPAPFPGPVKVDSLPQKASSSLPTVRFH